MFVGGTGTRLAEPEESQKTEAREQECKLTTRSQLKQRDPLGGIDNQTGWILKRFLKEKLTPKKLCKRPNDND